MTKKRFTDIEIWDEDWFIELEITHKMLWFYIKDTCDHAGIWKPNLIKFNRLVCEVNVEQALVIFNANKERVVELKNGRWFITGFIPFQYGTILNIGSPMHRSVYDLLIKNEVNLTLIRPQIEVRGRAKDKDKDKEKDKEHFNNLNTFIYTIHSQWNNLCDDFPILSKVREITDSRRTSIKKRYESKSFREFNLILDAIREQPFVLGKGKPKNDEKPWVISFDWIIKNDTNYMKVLERKYKGETSGIWRLS